MHATIVWLTAFIWTLALELPIYGWLLRRRLKGPGEAFLLVLTVNLLTHPLLWMANLPSTGSWLGAEGSVALVEGLTVVGWLGGRSLGASLAASAAANAISAGAGFVFAGWCVSGCF